MPHPAPYLAHARTADELEALLFDEDDNCKTEWLLAARAPESAWRELLARLDWHWPITLAHSSTDPVVLNLLSTGEFGEDEKERTFVGMLTAQNRYTPATALRALATRDHLESRRDVAGNPSTPMDVLELLAGDEEERVRAAVARRFDRWFLAQDKYHRVQRELAAFAAQREQRTAERAAREAFRRSAKRQAKADPASAPARPRLP